MQLITVCDFRYLHEAQRLAISLQKSGNRQPLVIFCDDPEVFEPLRCAGCALRVVPEIGTLGAKRAKLTAYTRALAEFGDVLYLDADIIVLSELSHLHKPGALRACPDDLSGCAFITDTRHPWPGDQDLTNHCYFNSGVLHLPATLSGFFERLRQLSLDDKCWNRHIFAGRLYDNHFLCAHINLNDISVEFLDEHVYNWQGFLRKGELQVVRRGSQLVNRHSGKELKLAHFAGVADVDKALCSLPADVAALLCERSTEDPGRRLFAFTRFQAACNSDFLQPMRDDFVQTVYENARRELLAVADGGWRRDFERQDSYLTDPDGMLSVVYSRPSSQALWNGLQCGGAYLEGDEYNYLSGLVRTFDVRSVLETGAGETSICFQMAGARSRAIESSLGPWLERAQAAGCPACHVPFLSERCEFEPSALDAALSGLNEVDLIFVDSPIGTRSRSRVLTQLMRKVRARLVLFHDVHRDATNIYQYQAEHGLRVVDYLPSRRGMLLLSTGSFAAKSVPRTAADVKLSGVRCSLTTSDTALLMTAGTESNLRITLTNRGSHILSSRYQNSVRVTYHWLDEAGGIVVYDGARTLLPFDIYPGNAATFGLRVLAPQVTGIFTLQIAIVQERVAWFDAREDSLMLAVNVT